MSILVDPMLALIARFVVKDIDDLSFSDEAFLRQQFKEVKGHIEDAPKEQQQKLALTWIKEHAEQYRREWQRKTFSRMVLAKRCPDCPLRHDDSKRYCTIHTRWVVLLKDFIADKISSTQYVEETLDLLKENKANLKISARSSKIAR